MRIGAVCGVHGTNEQFSVDVYQSLYDNPIEGVEPILANELAVASGDNVRFVDENMSHSFVHPDRDSPIYERRRAAEVIAWAKHSAFDLLVDIHSCKHDDRLYATTSMNASNAAIKVAKFFGYRNILIEDYNIHQHFPNAILLEYFGAGRKQKRIADLRCDLGDLAAYQDLDDFDDDYTNYDEVNYWMYGGTIPVGV